MFCCRYAPFCKHIFMPNFTETVVGELEITEENVHLLKYALLPTKRTEQGKRVGEGKHSK